MNSKNAIYDNNFFGYNILGIFDMKIKLLRIFGKFSKIPLMEMAVSGWPAATVDCGWRQPMVASGSWWRQSMIDGMWL